MQHDKENHEKNEVQVTINEVVVTIHRGSQQVSYIKEKGEVHVADILNVIENGTLQALPNDGRYTIKGGEIFVSQQNSGGSS